MVFWGVARLVSYTGVAINLSRELNERLIEWEPLSARIIPIILELKETISVIQIYAPTEHRSADEKDEFYSEPQIVAKKFHLKTDEM